MRCRWYRGVGILDPRARWVSLLGPVGTPNPIGISAKGNLYTYILQENEAKQSLRQLWQLFSFSFTGGAAVPDVVMVGFFLFFLYVVLRAVSKAVMLFIDFHFLAVL